MGGGGRWILCVFVLVCLNVCVCVRLLYLCDVASVRNGQSFSVLHQLSNQKYTFECAEKNPYDAARVSNNEMLCRGNNLSFVRCLDTGTLLKRSHFFSIYSVTKHFPSQQFPRLLQLQCFIKPIDHTTMSNQSSDSYA